MKQRTWKKRSRALLALTLATLMLASCTAQTERSEAWAEQKAPEERRILVVGCDDAASLADVMMIVRVGKDGADIVQLPRDTYARYTESSYRKLNGALSSLGDMKALCAFLEQTLGTELHGYVRMDHAGFVSAVDALGGVTVSLPYALEYYDPEQELAISLAEGEQHLDGEQALQFVRFRSAYVRGDLGRLDAQKIFLAAVLRRAREELTPMEAIRLVFALVGKLHTDLPLAEAIALVRCALSVSDEQVRMVTLPGTDARIPGGAWFYFVSRPSALTVVREYLDGAVSEESFDPRRVLCSSTMERLYITEVTYCAFDAKDASEGQIHIATRGDN